MILQKLNTGDKKIEYSVYLFVNQKAFEFMKPV